jgi:hypothetical protein
MHELEIRRLERPAIAIHGNYLEKLSRPKGDIQCASTSGITVFEPWGKRAAKQNKAALAKNRIEIVAWKSLYLPNRRLT